MNKIKDKTAVILCGGKGSRLGSLGKKIPKSLLKISGYPIIWYIIKILKKNSFNHFILPVGFKGNMIKRFINSNKDLKNLNIEIIDTGTDTNIAKRIFLVKDNINSDNFLLLNGDAIFDFNLKSIYQKHIGKKRDLTFIGCENQLPYGTVGIINNKIVSFDRNITFNSVKVRGNKNLLAYIYSGMSIMNKNILKLDFKKYDNFEKELYPKLLKKFKCEFVVFKGFWHSIDNLKDINATKNNNMKHYGIKNVLKKIK